MRFLITVLTYPLFIAHTVCAQEVVPVHEEPRHHLVYDNDILQVLDVQIPEGDTTLYHTHDSPIFTVGIFASSTDDQELGGQMNIRFQSNDSGSFLQARHTFSQQVQHVVSIAS